MQDQGPKFQLKLKWRAKIYKIYLFLARQIVKNSKNPTMWRHNDVIITWRIFWRHLFSFIITNNWWKFEVVISSQSENMAGYILWWFHPVLRYSVKVVLTNYQYLRVGLSYDPKNLQKGAKLNFVQCVKILFHCN